MHFSHRKELTHVGTAHSGNHFLHSFSVMAKQINDWFITIALLQYVTIVTLTIVNLLVWFLIFLIVSIISIVYHILVAWYIQFCITPLENGIMGQQGKMAQQIKGAYQQAWQTKIDSWDSHDRGADSLSCALTFTHAWTHWMFSERKWNYVKHYFRIFIPKAPTSLMRRKIYLFQDLSAQKY